VTALSTIFSQDQIENLKLWKRSLETEVALGWKVEEDKAEEEMHAPPSFSPVLFGSASGVSFHR